MYSVLPDRVLLWSFALRISLQYKEHATLKASFRRQNI